MISGAFVKIGLVAGSLYVRGVKECLPYSLICHERFSWKSVQEFHHALSVMQSELCEVEVVLGLNLPILSTFAANSGKIRYRRCQIEVHCLRIS